MSWLAPIFLGGVLWVGLPIALHLLRRRTQVVVPFPTLRFLGTSAVLATKRHRLMRWITLLLRCAIIALLAAAFARPFWNHDKANTGSLTIIALDNSMSMQAGSRWADGLQWARQELASLPPGSSAGLLLMHPEPRWLVPVTDEPERVQAALAAQPPGYQTTRYAPSLQAAIQALASRRATEKKLLWIGDGQRNGWVGVDWGTPLPAGVTFRTRPPNPFPDQPQASLAQLRWIPTATTPRIHATVRNWGGPHDRRIVLTTDSGHTTQHAFALAANETLELELDLPAGSQPEWVEGRLDPDVLPADDGFYLTIQNRQESMVLLNPSTARGDFLAHALTASKNLPAFTNNIRPYPDGVWPRQALAIARGPDFAQADWVRRLDDHLAHDGRAWVWVDGSKPQANWLSRVGFPPTPLVETSHLGQWDPAHPMLTAFRQDSLLPLLEAEFYRPWTFGGSPREIIARWDNGSPAILETGIGTGTVLLFGFDARRSDTNWSRLPSFVPVIHQTLVWLLENPGQKTDWRVGDTIPLPETPGRWTTVLSPAAQPPEMVSHSIRPAAPGLYQYSTQGGETLGYAVNTPADESDLTPWPNPSQIAAWGSGTKAATEPGPLRMTLADEAAESNQQVWWWLVALAGLFLFTELFIANRTSL
jgi:hypothetical protein